MKFATQISPLLNILSYYFKFGIGTSANKLYFPIRSASYGLITLLLELCISLDWINLFHHNFFTLLKFLILSDTCYLMVSLVIMAWIGFYTCSVVFFAEQSKCWSKNMLFTFFT